jgi:hypothetical protein
MKALPNPIHKQQSDFKLKYFRYAGFGCSARFGKAWAFNDS